MSEKPKLYWDTSCFIAFISGSHPEEAYRTPVCVDVLENAEKGVIELWTSVFTIAEVIRRKLPLPKSKPLPRCTKVVQDKAPEALPRIQELWDFQCRKSAGTRALAADEISNLQEILRWTYIKKIQFDESTARQAVELSQQYGLKAPDAIHVASARAKKCDRLQAFDTDYSAVAHLIKTEEPQQISAQGFLTLSP